MKHSIQLLAVICICGAVGIQQLSAQSFMEIEAETVGRSDFRFPHDALQSSAAVFGLAMSTSRENGEQQQEQLLQWQRIIDTRGLLPTGMPMYHFPVIESPPFFVRGLIRRGIRDVFRGKVDDQLAAVLFVDSTSIFASQAGIPLDSDATIVVVNTDGSLRGYIKGEPSEVALAELQKLLTLPDN